MMTYFSLEIKDKKELWEHNIEYNSIIVLLDKSWVCY